jgi:hypothetical protein
MTQSDLKLESTTGLSPSNSVSSILRTNAAEGVGNRARGWTTLIRVLPRIQAENTCLELCIAVPCIVMYRLSTLSSFGPWYSKGCNLL